MLLANWIHPQHHWRPRLRWPLPQLPRLPRLHLSHPDVATVRAGAILVLCTLLAGGLALSLRGAVRGPFTPSTTSEPTRA
jgi:hypothetical protein